VLASQYHLLNHAFFKALLFLAAGSVIHNVGTRDMRQMGGLGRQMPLTRALMVIGASVFVLDLIRSTAAAGRPVFDPVWTWFFALTAAIFLVCSVLKKTTSVFRMDERPSIDAGA